MLGCFGRVWVLALVFTSLIAADLQTAQAGVIPWMYDTIFGPVGSIRERRMERLGGGVYAPAPYITGYPVSVGYPGYMGPGYGGTFLGNSGGCSTCQTSNYLTDGGPFSGSGCCGFEAGGCGSGNCGIAGCANGNCGVVNYGGTGSDCQVNSPAGNPTPLPDSNPRLDSPAGSFDTPATDVPPGSSRRGRTPPITDPAPTNSRPRNTDTYDNSSPTFGTSPTDDVFSSPSMPAEPADLGTGDLESGNPPADPDGFGPPRRNRGVNFPPADDATTIPPARRDGAAGTTGDTEVNRPNLGDSAPTESATGATPAPTRSVDEESALDFSPLYNLQDKVASRTSAVRQRLAVRATFTTPSVVRARVTPDTHWLAGAQVPLFAATGK